MAVQQFRPYDSFTTIDKSLGTEGVSATANARPYKVALLVKEPPSKVILSQNASCTFLTCDSCTSVVKQ